MMAFIIGAFIAGIGGGLYVTLQTLLILQISATIK